MIDDASVRVVGSTERSLRRVRSGPLNSNRYSLEWRPSRRKVKLDERCRKESHVQLEIHTFHDKYFSTNENEQQEKKEKCVTKKV